MAHFTDRHGQQHHVVVTGKTMIEAKRRLGFNLCSLCGMTESTEGVRMVLDNIELFTELLHLCLVDNSKSVLEIADLLSGDALNEAQSAFIEAVIDFLPDPMTRQYLKLVYDQAEEMLTILKTNPSMAQDYIQKTLTDISLSCAPFVALSQNPEPIAS